MKHRDWGHMINFCSGSVFDGTRSQTHYVSAKAGMAIHSLPTLPQAEPDQMVARMSPPHLRPYVLGRVLVIRPRPSSPWVRDRRPLRTTFQA